jgi:hypothetical protein
MDAQKIILPLMDSTEGSKRLNSWDEKPKVCRKGIHRHVADTIMMQPKGSAHNLAAIVSAFVPTWFTACLFIAVFVLIRNRYPKIYSPRTFIGTIPEKYVISFIS